VSGELHISDNPVILRLIRALQTLAQEVPSAEFAVIGGLAVMVRLQGAHRVTDDLDTVATQHGDDPTRVEIVTGVDGAIEGTKVDCIAVGDVPAAELLSEELPEDEPTGRSSSPTDGRSIQRRIDSSVPMISSCRRQLAVGLPAPQPLSPSGFNLRHGGRGAGPTSQVATCSISSASFRIQN
jgi:hypothetical protein